MNSNAYIDPKSFALLKKILKAAHNANAQGKQVALSMLIDKATKLSESIAPKIIEAKEQASDAEYYIRVEGELV